MAKSCVSHDSIVLVDEDGHKIDISSHCESWHLVNDIGNVRKLVLTLHYDPERHHIDTHGTVELA